MNNSLFYTGEFDEKFRAEYQKGAGHCIPTNPDNTFDKATTEAPAHATTPRTAATAAATHDTSHAQQNAEKVYVFNCPVADFIHAMYPDGAPQGSRHKSALKLASDLMILLDGNEQAVKNALVGVSWVADVISETRV